MDLAYIDEQISQQKLTLCDLGSRRNSLAFISRLPTELLESIFVQLARDCFWSDAPPTLCMPDWARVSHVSSHWRNVALNSVVLWSYIFSTSRQWVDVLLARSQQAPLKIRIDVENRARFARLWTFVGKILEDAKRIEELRFCTRYWNKQTDRCFAKLCSATSHLRVLDFSMKPLPENLPGFGTAPPPACQLFTLWSLTTLNLRFSHPSLQTDFLVLRTVLRYLPDLVNLYLEDALARSNVLVHRMGFDPSQTIRLPRLSRLLVAAPFSAIVVFLSSVNIPVRTEIRLECTSKKPPTRDRCKLFCSILAEHYNHDRAPSFPTVRSVAIKFDHHDLDGVAFAFSTASECDFSHRDSTIPLKWGSNILLELAFGPQISIRVVSKLGSVICASVPARNAQTLQITGSTPCQTFWKETLGHLPGLRRMKFIHGCMREDMVSALASCIAEESVGNRSGEVSTPALEELAFCRMRFHRLAAQVGGPKVLEGRSTAETDLDLLPFQGLQSLCSALSSRAGSPGRLIMTSCHVQYGVDSQFFDMTGEWKDGHFNVVKLERKE